MKTRGVVFAVLALAWTIHAAHATTLVWLSLDQLAQAASEIVRGRVLSQETRWNDSHTRIVTVTTLAVEQSFRGHAPSRIEIEQPGGTIGNIHVHVAATVRFFPQSRYLLFLEPSLAGPPRYLVVGMMQGAFRIYREESSGQERVILPLGALARGSGAAAPRGAVPGPTLPLQEFQQEVTSVLAAPLAIPRGTVISVTIRSAESRGVGRLRVVARTTGDIFPNPGMVIPAGSIVEGTAMRESATWKIHWDEVNIRGTHVPISASSEEPAGGSLAGLMAIVKVK